MSAWRGWARFLEPIITGAAARAAPAGWCEGVGSESSTLLPSLMMLIAVLSLLMLLLCKRNAELGSKLTRAQVLRLPSSSIISKVADDKLQLRLSATAALASGLSQGATSLMQW